MKLFSTLGVLGVIEAARPDLEAAAGERIEIDFNPTQIVLEKIRAGGRADVAILTTAGIEMLTAEGLLAGGSRVDLARSLVGLAVKAGARRPDISTVADVKRALTEAQSVVYSRKGQSGIFFARLIERLGIAAEVNARAIVIDSGTTGDLVAEGRGEIAVQQVSELLIVPGVDVVGPLPDEIQDDLVFAGAVFRGSPAEAAGRRFLAAMTHTGRAELYRRAGLAPIARG